jgi:hypothetical protein
MTRSSETGAGSLRGQSSIEYIAILALGLAVLLPLSFAALDALNRETTTPQAEVAARRIAAAADAVAAQGVGAAVTVDFYLPPGIDPNASRTFVAGRLVQFTLEQGGQRVEVFAVTRANLTGSLPTSPGRYFVRLHVLANGTVNVTAPPSSPTPSPTATPTPTPTPLPPPPPVLLRAVHRGNATIAQSATSVTTDILATIDTSASFLVFGINTSSNDPGESQVSGRILNATHLVFERTEAPDQTPAIQIQWYVAEFSQGVRVQRGSASMGSTTVNVPLTPIDTSRSFPIVTYRVTGNIYDNTDYVRAKITNATNLELTMDATGGTAEWQVVEYGNAAVQSDEIAFAAGDATRTAILSPVNASKAWLLYTFQSATGTEALISQKLVYGILSNSTALTFNRNNTGQTLALSWYLVEFNDNTTVQRGSAELGPASIEQNQPLSPITLNASLAVGGHWQRGGASNYSSDDNPGTGWFQLNLTNTTNLRIERGAALDSTAHLPWQVVSFGSAGPSLLPPAKLKQVHRGSSTLPVNTTSLVVALPAAVATNASFLVFGTNFTNNRPSESQVSGRLVNSTHLNFSRWEAVGPAIQIQWYVAEFLQGVRVQRGSSFLSSTTTNVAVNYTEPARSFPLISYRIFGSTYGADDFVRAKLTSSVNLALSADAVGSPQGQAEWQVVEYANVTVTSGDLSFGTADLNLTADVAITNTSKAWLYYNYQSAGGTSANIAQKLVHGTVTNATTLSFNRTKSGQTLTLTWYLLEFADDTTVQSGSTRFTTTQSLRNTPVTTVPLNATLAVGGYHAKGGQSNFTADDNPGTGWFHYNLTNTTNLRISRGATSASQADAPWHVITFPT